MSPEDFTPHPQALQEEEAAHVQGVVQVENKKEAVTGTGSASSASSVDRPRLKPRPPVPSAPVTASEVPTFKGPTAFIHSTTLVTLTPKKAPPQLPQQMPKAEAKPPTGPPPPVVASAVRLEIPEDNRQQTPVTPVTGSVRDPAEE
eukprot:6491053-Amphidinium_carterae.3